jgi:outer membrane receptor protein involved in Fe transport
LVQPAVRGPRNLAGYGARPTDSQRHPPGRDPRERAGHDYSDLGAFLTPRLAAVWRIDDSNILKLQYAWAFRPPTFYEQAYPGRDSIGAGEIATYELGYILKQPRWEGRLILFQSDLTDPIVFGEDDGVYPDGYPRPGRRWWLSVGYAF